MNIFLLLLALSFFSSISLFSLVSCAEPTPDPEDILTRRAQIAEKVKELTQTLEGFALLSDDEKIRRAEITLQEADLDDLLTRLIATVREGNRVREDNSESGGDVLELEPVPNHERVQMENENVQNETEVNEIEVEQGEESGTELLQRQDPVELLEDRLSMRMEINPAERMIFAEQAEERRLRRADNDSVQSWRSWRRIILYAVALCTAISILFSPDSSRD